MSTQIIEIQRGSPDYPKGLDPFFEKEPPRLWYVGEPSILNNSLLGIVSARKIEPDLALKVSELLRQLPTLEVAFIGGWHSPLEEEALRILLNQLVRIVFCVPKSLSRFVPSAEVADVISQRRGLLLSHCSPKAKRISRDASLRRNRLIAGLSRGMVVLSAPPASASLKLAQLTIQLGKPVFAAVHRTNEELLRSGALPATLENIQGVFE